MARRGNARWYQVLMALGLVVACRGHEAVCEGQNCALDDDVQLPSGSGGGGGGESEPDGDAGNPPLAACRRDRDCDNQLECDGTEVCVDGMCGAGAPVACPHPGMRCDDEAESLCVFDAPSPWFVVARGTTIEGLPLNRLGEQPLIELSRREPSRALGFLGAVFTPDGQHAVVASLEEEHLLSYKLMHFGAGLPTLEPLPEVPNLVDLFDAFSFSGDSKYALVEDSYTGTYLVSLKDPHEPTVLHPRDQFGRGFFCDDPRSYFLESGADTSIFTIGAETPSAVEGRHALSNTSHRFLVLSPTDSERLLIRHCSDDTTELELVGVRYPTLGPNDALLVERVEGGMELYALGDLSEPRIIWSTNELQLSSPSFSRDGRYLVGTADYQIHLADLDAEDPAPQPLGFPEGADLPYADGISGHRPLVGDRAFLVWFPGEGGARQLYWQPLDTTQERQLLADDPNGLSVQVRVDAAYINRPLIGIIEGNREHLLSVRLDTAAPELEPIATFESGITVTERAPDGSGLGVLVATSDLNHDAFFVPFDPGGQPGNPRLIATNALSFSFQPWP